MALFAQHGHGKADRLSLALDDKSLDGIIFGARNELPENMKECISSFKGRGEILFDPQFYVSTFAPPNDRFLPEYGYYKAGLTASDFVGMRKVGGYCKRTLDFEMELGVDKLISPTVLFTSFDDRWAQVALNLADAALEYHASIDNAPPLLVSFVIGEQALTSRKQVEAFLDQVTSWELDGLYLIFAREDSAYSQGFDPQRLAHALYMQHVLGEINGFEVVNGFSDFCGLLLRAVGGTAFATGWSQGLRQFHKRSFTKQKPGGQLPRLRYSSAPLLNSIFLSELEQVRDIDELDSILSGVPLDEVLISEENEWGQRNSELHHWQTLAKLDSPIKGPAAKSVKKIELQIESALALYRHLQEEGIVFSNGTGPAHLEGWRESLRVLKGLITL